MRGQDHIQIEQKIVLEPRHDYQHDRGWCRNAVVDGVTYCVGVERGKPVRIAFKPRGQNKGWTYYGFVRNAQGKEVWGDKVNGSLGAKGLLLRAGIVKPTTDAITQLGSLRLRALGIQGESP